MGQRRRNRVAAWLQMSGQARLGRTPGGLGGPTKKQSLPRFGMVPEGASLKRRYRLRGRNRFLEIRRRGQRWVHPFVVLGGLPNELDYTRCGFVVSRKLGRAVERNRIRRRLREAVRVRFARIRPGWDLVLVARPPIRQADSGAVGAALKELFRQAGLWQSQEDSERA